VLIIPSSWGSQLGAYHAPSLTYIDITHLDINDMWENVFFLLLSQATSYPHEILVVFLYRSLSLLPPFDKKGKVV
jgi:hypothetical protein